MPSQFPLISVNGVINASVSPLDRGFAYGDGLFETCLYRMGVVPLWEFHRQRLLDACKLLMIPLDTARLETYITDILQQAQHLGVADGVVKVIVTRGCGGRGYAFPESVSPTICVIFFDALPDDLQHIKLRICKQRLSSNRALAGLKHLNRLEQIMARAEWKNDYAEGLMLDDEGGVIEATASNVFMVQDGQLFTPDLSFAGVAGIMRRVIIERLAPALNLAVAVKRIMPVELQRADEMFICNSIRGIVSVAALDGETPTRFSRHEITHSLRDQLAILLRDISSEVD